MRAWEWVVAGLECVCTRIPLYVSVMSVEINGKLAPGVQYKRAPL